MEYKKALENLRQYNREYSTGNELLESVVACINYIVEDSENERFFLTSSDISLFILFCSSKKDSYILRYSILIYIKYEN